MRWKTKRADFGLRKAKGRAVGASQRPQGANLSVGLGEFCISLIAALHRLNSPFLEISLNILFLDFF